MNQSKVRERRFWKKWYASGAVPQRQYPNGSLKIGEISRNHDRGTQTLTLGRRLISTNEHGAAYGSVCCVEVASRRQYQVGEVLDALPKNAIPVELY